MSELTDRIRARCIEVDGCLEWNRALSEDGGMYHKLAGKQYSVRRALWEEKNGPVSEGKVLTASCRNPKCVRHLQAITFSQRNTLSARNGFHNSPAYRAKVAKGRSKNSKLSDEAVARIRAFEGDVPEIASAEGISESYAYMLRRGEFRQPPANPFAWLGARV